MEKQKFDKLASTSTKTKFDDSDEYESSSEEEELKRELADVSFEEILNARANGFHALHQKPKKEGKKEKKDGRVNKNRPMEMSSKKPVSRFRDVIQAPKKVFVDPRFQSLHGTLDTDGFRKRYSFLYEAQLPAEKEELQKQLKKTKDPDVVTDLKNRIASIDKQLKAGPSKHAADKAIVQEHKKKEREAAKEGKRPYYLKKSEIREKALIDKYNSLKAAGKLEAFIEKKRKKNASKDHRYVPYRRPANDE